VLSEQATGLVQSVLAQQSLAKVVSGVDVALTGPLLHLQHIFESESRTRSTSTQHRLSEFDVMIRTRMFFTIPLPRPSTLHIAPETHPQTTWVIEDSKKSIRSTETIDEDLGSGYLVRVDLGVLVESV